MTRGELIEASAPAGFSGLLRQHRLTAGLTQESLAERAGLSEHGIQKLESGATHPYRDTTERLIRALKLGDKDEARFKLAARPPPRRHQYGPIGGGLSEDFGATTSRVPRPLTPLIGRQREIVEIERLIGTSPLVTLTGAGGCGKTRLALEVAGRLAPSFADGVCFVDLAPLADPSLVSKAVAAGLDLSEQPGRPLVDVLADALRRRTLLLVLDNCEHLVQPCAELIDGLLRSCDGLHVLATSRHVLRLSGETVWRVPSLGLPGLSGRPQVAHTADSEAIQLFVARARAASAGFALTDQNVSVVASICHRLDGIPLALELAAARVAALGVEEIAARLIDCFALLTSGSRTALPRQQTLRGTLDWSYELLSEPQRILLRRLAVFAGGWTLEAAEQVCGWADLVAADVCDLLVQLTDMSLVVAELQPKGGMRYRLLETVRQYAQLRLADDGSALTLHARHAQYYLEVAEEGDAELRGPGQIAWLDRLEDEHDNFRGALVWSETHREADFSVRLVGALAWFWRLRSHFSEGRRWLRTALAASHRSAAKASTAVRVRALVGAGLLAFAQSDHVESTRLLEDARVLARQTGDTHGLGWALHGLARTAQHRGEYDQTIAYAEASVDAFRAIEDHSGIAYSLYYLGRGLAEHGEIDRAAAIGEQSAALFREIGDSWGLLWVVIHLGGVAAFQGAYQRSNSLNREALRLSQRVGTSWGMRNSLIGLARACEGQARPVDATRFLGAADALGASVGLTLGPTDWSHVARIVTWARGVLGEAEFGATWAEGHTTPFGRLIASELAVQDEPVVPGVGATPQTARQQAHGPAGLTAREREVAELIAQGLSNREIATALVIARRTADTHVGNVLSKLQLHTRAQVAVWTVEHRLTM